MKEGSRRVGVYFLKRGSRRVGLQRLKGRLRRVGVQKGLKGRSGIKRRATTWGSEIEKEGYEG